MFKVLFIIVIFSGIAGIVLFITGLIRKKQRLWVTGIVLTGFTAILLIISVVMAVMRSSKYINSRNKFEMEQFQYNKTKSENIEIQETSPSLEEKEGVNGFIKGIDEKLTKVDIKADSHLKKQGVNIAAIDDYTIQTTEKNGIPLKIIFNEDYTNNITLIAYDHDYSSIGAYTIACSGKKGEEQKKVFIFSKKIHFSDIYYCILTQSNQ
jgi:hypothetical protein